jgi:hypothetical protein
LAILGGAGRTGTLTTSTLEGPSSEESVVVSSGILLGTLKVLKELELRKQLAALSRTTKFTLAHFGDQRKQSKRCAQQGMSVKK